MNRNFLRPSPAWFALIFGALGQGLAQPVLSPPLHPAIPFVSVTAAQPLATEPGNHPATFTISRFFATNSALTVDFKLGGTATNGVDYAEVSNSVTLAAGQYSASVVITPVSEPSAHGRKTVVLTLPSRRFGPVREQAEFVVGSPASAVAYIIYNYTNAPPVVKMAAPTNSSTFFSRPNIELAANASDSNGWVTSVEFFANNASVGVVSNYPFASYFSSPIGPAPGRCYQLAWTNVPPGNYSVTAMATDNAGLQTTSSAINIVVTTNLPTPKVRIISPANGAEFPDLAPINIYAAAGEANGVVNKVEFFANGSLLGTATNYLASEPTGQFHLSMQVLPYNFRWTNAPVGSNLLTAVAIDNNGTRASSAAVNINVSTNSYHFPHRW